LALGGLGLLVGLNILDVVVAREDLPREVDGAVLLLEWLGVALLAWGLGGLLVARIRSLRSRSRKASRPRTGRSRRSRRRPTGSRATRQPASVRLLAEWEGLVARVPAGEDPLRWLSNESGIQFRALDFARRTRNRVAHPDTPLPADDIGRALEVVKRARQALR
jgi:hypothetical protein